MNYDQEKYNVEKYEPFFEQYRRDMQAYPIVRGILTRVFLRWVESLEE